MIGSRPRRWRPPPSSILGPLDPVAAALFFQPIIGPAATTALGRSSCLAKFRLGQQGQAARANIRPLQLYGLSRLVTYR